MSGAAWRGVRARTGCQYKAELNFSRPSLKFLPHSLEIRSTRLLVLLWLSLCLLCVFVRLVYMSVDPRYWPMAPPIYNRVQMRQRRLESGNKEVVQ
jgi:hypothetical protein